MTSIHDLEPQLTANRRYWCGWTGALPDTDLPIYRSDVRHGLLNGVLRVRHWPVERAIEEATRVLSGSRWSWWVGEDSSQGTAEGLLAHGFSTGAPLPIMAVDVNTVTPVDPPADLKIWPMVEPAEIRDYVRAYLGPLGFEPDDLDAVVERERHFAYPHVVRLGAVTDGRPVGTCTLSLGTEVAGLYCIATDPQYRRRGVATALTREALRITRDTGRRIATLQASPAGEPVYRAIGFATVGHYQMFAPPA